MNQVLAVGEKGALALSLIRAFSTGCQFEVECAVAQPATHAERLDMFGGMSRPLRAGEDVPDGLLRFGVESPDGAKATTLTRHPPWFEGGGPEPEPPVLVIDGGRGSLGGPTWMDMQYPLWLWPLPPAQVFDLVFEWPIAGIGLTRVPIDGAAIVEAAGQARVFVDR